MARIPYPDPATLSPEKQKIIANSNVNVSRMLVGASEGVFKGFVAFSGSFFKESPLPPVLREIAVLRAGYLCRSPYETFQHEALARRLGMSEAKIEAIQAGGAHPGVLDAAEQAVLDFAGDIVENVRASDRTLTAVQRHLPQEQVIDLILVTGCYIAMSSFLETTGVEVDHPVDWDTMDITKDALAKSGPG